MIVVQGDRYESSPLSIDTKKEPVVLCLTAQWCFNDVRVHEKKKNDFADFGRKYAKFPRPKTKYREDSRGSIHSLPLPLTAYILPLPQGRVVKLFAR